ncbi:hypothetical protein V8E54_009787 [Elaphomyces granulatus]
MKVSAVAFALTALLIGAVAQVPTPLPICAASCLKGPYSSCNPLDLTCVCSALVYAIACCIPGACNQADQDTTFQFAEKLCASDSAVRPPSNCATSTPTSFSTSRSTSTSSTSSASGAVTQVPGLPSCAEPVRVFRPSPIAAILTRYLWWNMDVEQCSNFENIIAILHSTPTLLQPA